MAYLRAHRRGRLHQNVEFTGLGLPRRSTRAAPGVTDRCGCDVDLASSSPGSAALVRPRGGEPYRVLIGEALGAMLLPPDSREAGESQGPGEVEDDRGREVNRIQLSYQRFLLH